ncbi:disease resistance-like protein DSC1 [Neltuma alba]|uniref:disease resistance-like protein DSC1 n=1 Tax=Neltuma alba TaxID=207710 RepID=UPI0010A3D366|nr:disease resistance-like protein DSC1 [Prosopis alba]
MAQNLETIDLTHCQNLRKIHPSVLSLPKLVSLNLRTCERLENLDGDNHLKSLKDLTLTGCGSLKELLLSSEEMRSLSLVGTGIETLNLPVGRFNKLEELYLGLPLRSFQINELRSLTSLRIFSLIDIEEGIDKSQLLILFDAWRSLEQLSLKDCTVSEIPDNISGLSLLKILSLRGCTIKSFPNSIKYLPELKDIDLGECWRLRSLPELPPSITHFYVDECTSLETIDFKGTIFEHNKEKSSWGLDRCDVPEFIHFTLMRAIYNNYSCEVKACYPGSTIPRGIKYSLTTERAITIELAPASSDHLLGIVSCCILSPLDLRDILAIVCRKFHCEDDEINYKDEKEITFILVWSDMIT